MSRLAAVGCRQARLQGEERVRGREGRGGEWRGGEEGTGGDGRGGEAWGEEGRGGEGRKRGGGERGQRDTGSAGQRWMKKWARGKDEEGREGEIEYTVRP